LIRVSVEGSVEKNAGGIQERGTLLLERKRERESGLAQFFSLCMSRE
jgi:hypothetical protein